MLFLYTSSSYYLIASAYSLQLPTIAFRTTITARRSSSGALISSLAFKKQHPPRVFSQTLLQAFHTTNMSSESSNDPLPCPIASHGKTVPQVSTTQFLFTAACVPVCAVTVLPLSVAYQVGKMALQPLLPSSQSKQPHLLDSGYVVDPSLLIPRAERKYDIVVLGVTGFTGYLAARHLLTQYGVSNSGKSVPVQWAIAGRSREKLEKVQQRLQQECHVDTSGLELIVVDTSVPSTLPQLVQNTRVVATTAGPYTLYGNSVVEFCAKFGTHYVDITGEVDWVKAMICQWQSTAQQTGAKLIPFCGHGAFPSL
jgi:Saccharopine dehydrogenase NADP binding domain